MQESCHWLNMETMKFLELWELSSWTRTWLGMPDYTLQNLKLKLGFQQKLKEPAGLNRVTDCINKGPVVFQGVSEGKFSIQEDLGLSQTYQPHN